MSNFKVTQEQVEAKIKNKSFTILPSGKTMICELTLENGFTVHGDASVVDKANFVQEIGEQISYKRAMDKIWEIEGYLMQERMYQSSPEFYNNSQRKCK